MNYKATKQAVGLQDSINTSLGTGMGKAGDYGVRPSNAWDRTSLFSWCNINTMKHCCSKRVLTETEIGSDSGLSKLLTQVSNACVLVPDLVEMYLHETE